MYIYIHIYARNQGDRKMAKIWKQNWKRVNKNKDKNEKNIYVNENHSLSLFW